MRFNRRIACPEDMSLRTNFTGVVKLLEKMRRFSARQRNERVFLDFKPIRRVDLPGALVVAAELDRWNRLKHGKLHSVDVNKWDPGIRRLLREIGFFDLLDVSSGAAEKPAPSDERYVKFKNWQDYLRQIAPGSLSNHAKLIQEAHGLRRSASRQKHRGLGLERDVRKYIEGLDCNGIYCINSLKGQYTVKTGAGARIDEMPEIVNFERSLNGTLIEWRVMLNEPQ